MPEYDMKTVDAYYPVIEHHCTIASAEEEEIKQRNFDKFIRPYLNIIDALMEEDPIAYESRIKSIIRYKNYLMEKYGIESWEEQDYRGDD